jgi:SH3-like domain-containing protein
VSGDGCAPARATVLDVGLVATFAAQARDKSAGADAATKAAIAADLAFAHRLIEAALTGLLVDVERGEDFRDDGHTSARAWLRSSVRTSDSEALHHVRVARLCADLPVVLDELTAGRLGVPQVRELARARANPRCGDQLHLAIDVLIESGEQDPFEVFVERVRQWERLADADGAHRDHEAAHEGRRARIATVGDTTYLDASTGNAQGAAMTEVLERFAQVEFAADWAATVLRHGDDANPGLLPRTDAQRRGRSVTIARI